MNRHFATIFFTVIPLLLSAQGADFDSLMKKYEGKNGITTFSISGKMLQSVSKSDENALSEIESLKIIILDDSENPNVKQPADLSSNLDSLLAKGKYTEVSSFSEDETSVKIYLANVKKSKHYIYSVKENRKPVCIIYLNGNINIAEIRKLTSGLRK